MFASTFHVSQPSSFAFLCAPPASQDPLQRALTVSELVTAEAFLVIDPSPDVVHPGQMRA